MSSPLEDTVPEASLTSNVQAHAVDDGSPEEYRAGSKKTLQFWLVFGE